MASASSSPAAQQHVVCYHYPCIDGIFSALAAHVHFLERGEAVRFFPLNTYGDQTAADLNLTGSETVYMCDFTGPPGFLVEVASLALRVIVLDHHKSAIDEFQAEGYALPANMELHFDIERSGATIALDYFKPTMPDSILPAYKLVEDGDLWRFVVPNSREFNFGFVALKLEYCVQKNPGIFEQLQALSISDLIVSGAQQMEEEGRLVAAALSTAFKVQLGGTLGSEQTIPCGFALAVHIDYPINSFLRSTLGNQLAVKSLAQGLQAIGVIAYREADMKDASKIKISMRGEGEGTNTERICKLFGGGGHRLASSCITSTDEFEAWKAA